MSIKRLKDFHLDTFLKDSNYKIPNKKLIISDLLMVPYDDSDESRYPAFMRGSYELIKNFKQDHPTIDVQPIYDDDVKLSSVVFNDISFYLGSFIMTSIIAPLFVAWLYDKWKKNFSDNEDAKINININIYDKEDDFSTVFTHKENFKHFHDEFIPQIKEYSDLKKSNQVSSFDDKYLGNKINIKKWFIVALLLH